MRYDIDECVIGWPFNGLHDAEKMADLSETIFMWSTNEASTRTDTTRTHTHTNTHTDTYTHTYTHTHTNTHTQAYIHTLTPFSKSNFAISVFSSNSKTVGHSTIN